MTWEIGVTTGCCTKRPIAHALEAVAGAGVRWIEIGTPPLHFNPWTAHEVDDVAAALERFGIGVVSMHAPFGGSYELSEPRSGRRDQAVALLIEAARALRRLNGDTLVVHPSDVPRHESDPLLRIRHAADAIVSVAAGCRPLGVRVAIETPLPHLVGGQPHEFQTLLEMVDDDIGACLDTGHAHLGHHLAGFFEVIGGRLTHVHLHDNRGTHDDHLAPGRGTVNWEAVFTGLAAVHYRGRLMLELHCPSGPLTDHFRGACAGLQALMERGGRRGSG